MSVLIIEDDEGVRDSLAELLTEEGYDVKVASEGSEALALLQQEESLPSLILLDLMMPTMNGGEFRKRQLSDPRLASIPVIVVSARPDVGQMAKELAAEDYLMKPMSFEALIHVVQNRAITVVTSTSLPGKPKTLQEAWNKLKTPATPED
jgi:CheY-like chemotaxis protein